MSSRTLLNLLLMAGLGALIALAVYEPGIRKPTTTLLTTLGASDISQFSLLRPGQADIVLNREQGKWWMERPYKAQATPFLDQNLDDLLSAATSAHYPLTELDAKLVGLSPAAAILELGKVTLRFGDIEPVHGNRYVQVGDTVYLIPDHLAVYTSVKAIELVSPALLPTGSHIVEIKLPALPLVTSRPNARDKPPADAETPARDLRQIDGAWTLRALSPIADTSQEKASDTVLGPSAESIPVTSSDDLTRWLDEWRYAQAIDITPLAQEAAQAAHDADNGIEVRIQDHDTIHFQVIATSPDLILARPDNGLSYRFSPEQAQHLLYPPAQHDDGQEPQEH